MQDEAIVQKEGAVSEGAVSKEVPEAPKGAEQPLTEERVAQLIADAVKGKSGEIERYFQSKADVKVAQAEYRARQAEARHAAMASTLKGLRPEQVDKLRLADLDAQARFNAALEEEERQRQVTTTFDQSFNESITEHIKSLDIDPTDKRIDWAKDSSDYVEKQRRILASAAKISKENLPRKMLEMEQAIAARLRKSIGWDSVDTGASSGAPQDVDSLEPREKVKYGLEHPVKRKK